MPPRRKNGVSTEAAVWKPLRASSSARVSTSRDRGSQPMNDIVQRPVAWSARVGIVGKPPA